MTTQLHTAAVPGVHHPAPTAPARRRGWAYAGVAGALTGFAGIVVGATVNAVFDDATKFDTDAIVDRTLDQAPAIWVFHLLVSVSALLLVVFGFGLARRLRERAAVGDSIAPAVAAAGLVLTSGLMLVGTAFDTEISTGAEGNIQDQLFVLYGHWIGTIPWLWIGVGLSGLAVFVAARQGGAPRWAGRVGLVLGGLTAVIGASPFEYMSLVTGFLWVLVTASGFAFRDRH